MSQLKEYIDKTLNDEYIMIKVLSESAVNKLMLYKQKTTDNQLVLIKSNYRNDDVFRKLKSTDTNGYLPQIYEVCSEDDYLYVLEEYIYGTTLFDMMKSKREFTVNEVKKLLIDLCNALQILHNMNIIHRDIKPENIMIHNDKACLIDLSIAKLAGNEKDTDTMNLGTIGYAAPEQYGFSQSQPTTDIYALGVLANQLMLGIHPTVDVPKGKIGRIIKKCTETQISKRYQNTIELSRALSYL